MKITINQVAEIGPLSFCFVKLLLLHYTPFWPALLPFLICFAEIEYNCYSLIKVNFYTV